MRPARRHARRLNLIRLTLNKLTLSRLNLIKLNLIKLNLSRLTPKTPHLPLRPSNNLSGTRSHVQPRKTKTSGRTTRPHACFIDKPMRPRLASIDVTTTCTWSPTLTTACGFLT